MDNTGKKPLDGINCTVNECCYYQQGDHCVAAHIDVKGANADTSDDTRCQTFKTDSMM